MAVKAFVCASCRALRPLATVCRSTPAISRRWASTSSSRRPLRLAIIGAGPAGYYVAYRIMKRLPESFVDMYETLPTPYGLVRFGVAPDHPEVKKSSENLDDVAKWPNFNFVGNVSIGTGDHELPLTTIAAHYDAIVFAYGASKDKKLGIPGEDLKRVYSARAFVGWYNGLPEFADLNPDLQSGDSAAIFGQGNVALDVSRVLLTPVQHLKHTDIAEHAIEALSRSKISKVSIVGRRGPLQAPATIKEIRELMTVPETRFHAPVDGWGEHVGVATKSLPRQLKRIMELLEKGSGTTSEQAQKVWEFLYLLKPVQFNGDRNSTGLESVDLERMQYAQPMKHAVELIINETKQLPEWERLPAILNRIKGLNVQSSGQQTRIPSSLAFRSIGYLSEPLAGMQDLGISFDVQRGVIPNDIHGRVLSPEQGPGHLAAAHLPGLYCAGWVKRGPTGVIASTLDDAFRTADILVDDWENSVPFSKQVSDVDKLGLDGVMPAIRSRGIRSVSWSDWEKIDSEERRRGELKGKPREKIVDTAEMLKIID